MEELSDLKNWTLVAASASAWSDQSGVPSGYERVSIPVDLSAVNRFLKIAVMAAP
ncbi:hypothetical protein N9154_00675 [Akkermansiaceae bacterium]|nr:hypothetical protein [Akkermansiaceae bacterium]